MADEREGLAEMGEALENAEEDIAGILAAFWAYLEDTTDDIASVESPRRPSEDAWCKARRAYARAEREAGLDFSGWQDG